MMQADDARYLKRKVKGGSIDVHPSELALVVNYEVEATILGELGDPMLGEKKQYQKIIRLKSLNNKTNIANLAQEVVEKCKLIHASKLAEVEQLLYYLRNRKGTQEKSLDGVDNSLDNVDVGDSLDDAFSPGETSDHEVANLNNLEDYVEMLYDDITSKLRGSALLLQLTRNPDNLEELLVNDSVLGALARVLREDWKKSIELSTNIIYTFFCFSTFSQFHDVISHFKVGALCMSILEHELKRQMMWTDEVCGKKPTNDDANAIKEYEKAVRKSEALIRKQDQLLRVGFYLLLNLAEDPVVEMKMRRRGVVELLLRALQQRNNADVLVLVVSFLKKLSIFMENKNQMAGLDVIPKLSKLIPHSNDDLLSLTLRLMLNLSFDSKLRKAMLENGLLPKIAAMINNQQHQMVVLCLLYHLSVEDKGRSMFSYTDCVPEVVKHVLESKGSGTPRKGVEAIAIGINLTTKKRNTQMICEGLNGRGLKLLFKKGFKQKDALIMKMIRNMSQHAGPTKNMFIEYISMLAKAAKNLDHEDFALECIGTLSNLTLTSIDYDLVLKEYNLVPYIKGILSGKSEDDLLLEIVMLIGTVSLDDNCAVMLAKSGIIQQLIQLLNDKQEDDELVLQIAYVFYQLVWHDATRNVIISDTQVPAYLIDLMHDRNQRIRKVCDGTLDIIMEFDDDWEAKIKAEKFRWHNTQWLEMLQNQDQEDQDQPGFYENDDYYNNPFAQAYIHEEDMLNNPELYYDSQLMTDDDEARYAAQMQMMAEPLMHNGYPLMDPALMQHYHDQYNGGYTYGDEDEEDMLARQMMEMRPNNPLLQVDHRH